MHSKVLTTYRLCSTLAMIDSFSIPAHHYYGVTQGAFVPVSSSPYTRLQTLIFKHTLFSCSLDLGKSLSFLRLRDEFVPG